MKHIKYRLLIIIIFFCSVNYAVAQKNQQDQLEERRQELREEIKKINSLLFQNTSKKKSQTSIIEDLSYKLSVRRNLIKITNEQANLITREINTNQNKIFDLEKELQVLKDNYSKLIVKSYKNKNKESRVMFLLSSSNFKQAYKRLQYINQYSDYQKKQGEEILTKTLEFQNTNTTLIKQKASKDTLIQENRIAQQELEKDVEQQQLVIASIQKNLDKFSAEIKAKQRKVNKIDREIKNIIKIAIARSKKKVKALPKSNTNVSKAEEFALTAETKLLAVNFLNNKGKLPWPVKKGVVKVRYGKQPHPIDKSLTIQSNGVRIATARNANVRTVFNGEVLAVSKPKRGSITIMIQHGTYVTSYTNLKEVYVTEGQKVKTKQHIGKVYTNSLTNETILRFSIFKNTDTQNPAYWVYKM